MSIGGYMNHDVVVGSKLALLSVATSFASIPLEDTTQIGQIASILIGIISGVVSLWKMFKRKK
jgi:hypothetical protein